MTMALLSEDCFDTRCRPEPGIFHRTAAGGEQRRTSELPLIAAKLRLPDAAEGVARIPLIELLERSVRIYSGTLLIGRAGSGKTALAAELARKVPKAVWYSIDAGDADWGVFSRYFQATVLGAVQGVASSAGPAEHTPLEMFAGLLTRLDARSHQWPALMVLDGVDHLFDSKWFAEFFAMLMASLPPHAHVLVLSRTRPPTPLWRLRSKQVINVVDERLLAFSLAETEKLFALHGRKNRREAAAALKECYGRVGKLVRHLETRGADQQR